LNRILVTSIALLLVASMIFVLKPAYATSIAENSWIPKAPLPNGVVGVVAVSANGRIYAVGGSNNFEYNLETNSWSQKQPMPIPMHPSFGIASCNDEIYVIGGGGTDQSGEPIYRTTNQVYNPLTDKWEIKKPMPTGRDHVLAASVNGKIYVIGGVNRDSGLRDSPTLVNEVYDPAIDSWSTKQSAPFPVNYGTCSVVGKQIYFIGGQADNGTLNQIYDTETDTWTTGASTPTAMGSVASGATTGVLAPERIYIVYSYPFPKETAVIGTNYSIPTILNIFDPLLNNWTTIDAPISQSENAMSVVNDTLFIIGGSSQWYLDAKYTGFIGMVPTQKVYQYIPFGYNPLKANSNETGSNPTANTNIPSNVSPIVLIFGVSIAVLLVVALLLYKRHR
jgi:hypothetical protein